MQYMAIVFGILSVCPGLIVMILFLCGSWFDSGDASLEKTTIGNYGMASSMNGTSLIGAMLALNPNISAAVGGVELTPTFSSKKGEGIYSYFPHCSSLHLYHPYIYIHCIILLFPKLDHCPSMFFQLSEPDMQTAIGFLFHADANNPPKTIAGLNKRTVIIALSALDLVALFGYFGFTLYFIVWTQRLAKSADENIVTIKDYSVRVRDVPPNASIEELKKFFDKWGEVSAETILRPLSTSRGFHLLKSNPLFRLPASISPTSAMTSLTW